jgi:hypothetical protein
MRCQKGVFRGALIVILVMSLSLFLSFSDIAKASESSWLDKAQEMMNKDDDLKQKGRADEEVIKGKEGGLAEQVKLKDCFPQKMGSVGPKGPRKNNFTFFHLGFRPSPADLHSRSPSNSSLFLCLRSHRSTKTDLNLSEGISGLHS